MSRPNNKYIAGTITVATGEVDYPVLENIFAAAVAAAAVTNPAITSWRDLLVGVSNVFVITFDKQITVKYGQKNEQGTVVAGDAAVWRNPVPSTTYRTFNELQSRENHTFNIDELYVTNASGSNCVIDVEIIANNNGPFLN